MPHCHGRATWPDRSRARCGRRAWRPPRGARARSAPLPRSPKLPGAARQPDADPTRHAWRRGPEPPDGRAQQPGARLEPGRDAARRGPHAQRLLGRGRRRRRHLRPARASTTPTRTAGSSVSCDDSRNATSAILIGRLADRRSHRQLGPYRVDADAATRCGPTSRASASTTSGSWSRSTCSRSPTRSCAPRSTSSTARRSTRGSAPFTLVSDAIGFTQVPALTYDMAQNDLFLVEEWNSGAGAAAPRQDLRAPSAARVLSHGRLPDRGAAGSSCPLRVQRSRPAERLRASGSRRTTRGSRTSSSATASSGPTHTVFSSTPGPVGRASVQWWQLDPARPACCRTGASTTPSARTSTRSRASR